MICEGPARNRALATTKRLTNSHRSKPPITENTPARGIRRHPRSLPINPRDCTAPETFPLLRSVRQLRHAGQHKAIESARSFDVAQFLQCGKHRIHLGCGDLAGAFKKIAAVDEVISLADVLLAEPARLHHDLD